MKGSSDQLAVEQMGATSSPAAGTVNKHLDEILAKLSADPATQTTLAAVLAKLSADPATQTTLAALQTQLGEVQVAPTANTVLARLKDILTGVVLAPGSNIIGKVGIDQMTKGAVTVAHSAITETATSSEIDCRGYNSLLVHWISDQTDKTWTISVQGAMGSGLAFVPLLDKATGLVASEITTDISGFFVISNIPDYVKVVCTEVDDGATCTCKVQPFNS